MVNTKLFIENSEKSRNQIEIHVWLIKCIKTEMEIYVFIQLRFNKIDQH